MKRTAFIILVLLSINMCWGQNLSEPEHLFKVFYHDKNEIKTEIPENEHAGTKLTGLLVHKVKIVLYGENSNTMLPDIDNVYIEILDTTGQLKPQYFRVIKLNTKKGRREATLWSNSPLGVKDNSSNFIPTMVKPVGDNTYSLSIKDLPTGHYLILYQENLDTLMEPYDFDK